MLLRLNEHDIGLQLSARCTTVPCLPTSLKPLFAMSASSTAATERLEKVENRLSEWEATARCRVKGAILLLQEGRTLESGSKELILATEREGCPPSPGGSQKGFGRTPTHGYP